MVASGADKHKPTAATDKPNRTERVCDIGGTARRAKLRMRPTDEPLILIAEWGLRRAAGTAAK